MLEHERIQTEPCGCRVDIVTGLIVSYCKQHEIDKEEEDKQLESENYFRNQFC